MPQPERIKSLQKKIAGSKFEAFIVSGTSNNYYLANVVDTGNKNAFYCVISKNGFKFVTSNFHLKQALEQVPRENIAIADKKTGFGQTIAGILANSLNIGFESDHLTYSQYESFKKLLKGKKLTPLRGLVEQARRIKDEAEIKLIKKAAAITDKSFLELVKLIKPGVNELWLKQKTSQIMTDLGATGVAFDHIIAGGKNSADPHYQGSGRSIKKGEMIIIDIGARYKNYNADMTRMVFVGKATEKYKKLYQIVLETNRNAIDHCKPGVGAATLFDEAVKNFARYGEDQYFTHSLGHGVGIDIHELPNISPNSPDIIENGMVFSIEPGIYHLGWGGIRIEDLCVMQNGKCKILSKISKTLIEI